MRRALLLVAALALLALPAAARADGDPASDWLLTQAQFVPPDDGVPAAYSKQLAAVLSDAEARGYRIRVAVIGTRYDLGSVYVDWQKPKRYTPFLSEELSFVYKGRVLVVMANGLAVARDGKPIPADQAVVDKILPAGSSGAALTAAATRAVVKLAAAHGAVVTVPPLGHTTKPTTGGDRVTIAAGGLVVVALLVAGGVWRRSRVKARA